MMMVSLSLNPTSHAGWPCASSSLCGVKRSFGGKPALITTLPPAEALRAFDLVLASPTTGRRTARTYEEDSYTLYHQNAWNLPVSCHVHSLSSQLGDLPNCSCPLFRELKLCWRALRSAHAQYPPRLRHGGQVH
jgi:hypothetical protein